MKNLLLLAVIVFLFGCAATPKMVQDCPDYFETDEEIKLCEERVIHREDVRFKRAVQEQQDKVDAEACWQYERGVWDKRNRRCRSGFELGMY